MTDKPDCACTFPVNLVPLTVAVIESLIESVTSPPAPPSVNFKPVEAVNTRSFANEPVAFKTIKDAPLSKEPLRP